MGREADRLDWERAYFMGIDVGTAATKGVIIDVQHGTRDGKSQARLV